MAAHPAPETLLRALHRGPATLDALAARLGGVDRDALLWALDDAGERGWTVSLGGEDCGPDGLCGTSAPLVVRLTDAGAAAARAGGDATAPARAER